jgi:putative acetyltransferase
MRRIVVNDSRLDSDVPGLDIIIRPEQPSDETAVHDVTEAAFATLDISDGSEPAIINRLRSAGALSLSPVADMQGRIIGHIAFSPVSMSDRRPGWYGLGPVSVLPDWSRRGIGSALIVAGLEALRASGAAGVVLIGHPEYYPRFEFRNSSRLACPDGPPEAFFVLPFDGQEPAEIVQFHGAFSTGEAGHTEGT